MTEFWVESLTPFLSYAWPNTCAMKYKQTGRSPDAETSHKCDLKWQRIFEALSTQCMLWFQVGDHSPWYGHRCSCSWCWSETGESTTIQAGGRWWSSSHIHHWLWYQWCPVCIFRSHTKNEWPWWVITVYALCHWWFFWGDGQVGNRFFTCGGYSRWSPCTTQIKLCSGTFSCPCCEPTTASEHLLWQTHNPSWQASSSWWGTRNS